jgi:hypothetical protein
LLNWDLSPAVRLPAGGFASRHRYLGRYGFVQGR